MGGILPDLREKLRPSEVVAKRFGYAIACKSGLIMVHAKKLRQALTKTCAATLRELKTA